MAKLSPAGPFGKTKNARVRGSKAKGLAYERKFGRRLKARQANFQIPGELFSGQWIRFQDARGFGFAQPDFYIVQTDLIVLFECKLTYKHEAWDQLQELYLPLLEMIYDLPVACIQVCRNMRADRIAQTPVNAWGALVSGCTFHWVGQ